MMNDTISADADGGPRSRVRTAGHSAQPPLTSAFFLLGRGSSHANAPFIYSSFQA